MITKSLQKGLLLIISGPSGVGKGTVCRELLSQDSRLAFSVSATSRQPRHGERDGVDYFFMSKEQFEAQIKDQQFVEYARVFDNYYGTPKAPLEALRRSGKDVILDIDSQGAAQIAVTCPDRISIFLLPPDLDILKQRLVLRGSEDGATLNCRFAEAEHEMSFASQYDYQVVNNKLEDTVAQVQRIIELERIKALGKEEE